MRCPYEDCTFQASTDDEVDDHRCAAHMHSDEPQAGSNLR